MDVLCQQEQLVKIGVSEQRIEQLEQRADKNDIKIEAIQAFQNKALGYAMAASALASLLVQYFNK